MGQITFAGKMEALEIARGHDGFLRGSPEPVVLFAIYVTNGVATRMLGRSLHRFRAIAPFPSRAMAQDAALPSWSIDAAAPCRFTALAVALEEDGGVDVQRLFGALEHHGSLSIFAADARDVEPMTIAQPEGAAWSSPARVEVVVDGVAASGTCMSDKWIGAVCWTMRPREGAPVSYYRLPFLSPDRKNDWTAIASIAH